MRFVAGFAAGFAMLTAVAAPCAPRAGRARTLAEADSLAALVESIPLQSRPMDPALIGAARRVLELRERELGADDARTADARQRLAGVHLRRGEPAAAESLMQRVVVARRAAKPASVPALALSLVHLADAQRATKKLALAVRTGDSATALLRSMPPDTALEVRLGVMLGDALAEMGAFPRSRAELEHAVSLAESQARPDSVLLAYAIRSLGRSLSASGDESAARVQYERAVAIQERTLGPDSPDLAATLYMGTYTFATMGDYVNQRRWAERSLAIREKLFGPSHPNLATALWAVGSATANLGEPEVAHAYYERAVRILRESPTASRADLATAVSNLGSNYMRLGDGPHALAALREARAMREVLFGPGKGSGAWSTTRLAGAMALCGDHPGAVGLLDSLFAGRVRLSPVDLSDALVERAASLRRLGRLAEAEADCARAYLLADSLFGGVSPVTLDRLALRAALRYQLGRRDGAFADAMRTEEGSRDAIREVARGLSEHEALGFERIRGSGLDVLMAMASDSAGLAPEPRARVLDAVVQSRLVVLDLLADERRARPREDASLDPLHARLEAARDAYAAAMVAALRQERPPDSAATAARARREQAERELAERSGTFRAALQRSSADLASVAAALPPGSALVSYVRHAPAADVEADAILDASPASRNSHYSAFVLRAGAGRPVLVPLGASGDVDARISRWVAACASPPPPAAEAARAAERRCTALGRAVRSAVWTPLERALAGADRVFVVPDGALHAINFLALPAPQGGYLAEHGPLVHRLTAERDLLPWTGAPAPHGLLAFGGADFDRASDDDAPAPLALASAGVRRANGSDSARVHFGPLPATTSEVDEIARLWRESAGPAGDGDVLERTGAAASEGAFKRFAPGRRVLHLATHGFALGGASGPAPEGTRAVGALSSAGVPAAVRRSAAVLPGLALAGANGEPDATGEDGFLTAEEITALDLSGVEWAVLSACESGLSDPEAVEAVQGLHRAFRRAGTRSVIMSLWFVDDVATRAWMRGLYEARLQNARSTAAAVRDACRGALRERRAAGRDTHPFYWAAFVAAGDWR